MPAFSFCGARWVASSKRPWPPASFPDAQGAPLARTRLLIATSGSPPKNLRLNIGAHECATPAHHLCAADINDGDLAEIVGGEMIGALHALAEGSVASG